MKKITLLILVTLIVFLASLRFVPSDFHPLAFAVSLTGLVWAIFSLGKSLALAVIGTAIGLAGWIIALFDHVCPAGFCGFLSLTFYYSISLAVVTRKSRAVKLTLLSVGTVLMAAAIYLSIYFPPS